MFNLFHAIFSYLDQTISSVKRFLGLGALGGHVIKNSRVFRFPRKTTWFDWLFAYQINCFFHSLVSFYVLSPAFFFFQHIFYLIFFLMFYYALLPSWLGVLVLRIIHYNLTFLFTKYDSVFVPLIWLFIFLRIFIPEVSMAYNLFLVCLLGYRGLFEVLHYLYTASPYSQDRYSQFLPKELLNFFHPLYPEPLSKFVSVTSLAYDDSKALSPLLFLSGRILIAGIFFLFFFYCYIDIKNGVINVLKVFSLV